MLNLYHFWRLTARTRTVPEFPAFSEKSDKLDFPCHFKILASGPQIYLAMHPSRAFKSNLRKFYCIDVTLFTLVNSGNL